MKRPLSVLNRMSWPIDFATAQNCAILQAEGVARNATQDKQPAQKYKPINLSRGWPNADLHPARQLNDAADTVLQNRILSEPALQYGPDPGYGPLRQSISAWLSHFYGVKDDPDRITITGGASQNLANVLAGFTDPNITKRIWMVTPTYYLASRIFEDAGFAGRLRAVPEDAAGIDVEYLTRELYKLQDEKPRGPPTKKIDSWRKTYTHIIYCVPTFGNPSTKTMKESRRRQLLLLAAKHNALVITDDVYDFLKWSMKETTLSASTIDPSAQKALLPRITDIEQQMGSKIDDEDGFGFSMSNGSFSKILGPGVRTGWADCKPKLAYGLSQVGATKSGGAPSQVTASFIDQMLTQRTLQNHIAKVLLPNYQKRHMVMMHSIKQALEPLGVTVLKESLHKHDFFGGYFVWITLPGGLDSDMVALECLRDYRLTVSQGIQFKVAGDDTYQQDEMLRPCIRLCFSYEAIEDLREGIHRLKCVVEGLQIVAKQGPMTEQEVDSMIHLTSEALDWAKPFVSQSDWEKKIGLLEKLVPAVGTWLREARVRGFSEAALPRTHEMASKVNEFDKLLWDARRKVWGGSPAELAQGEIEGEKVHATCGTAKATSVESIW